MTRLAAILIVALVALAIPAARAQTPEQRANCNDDVRKLCAGVNPDRGGIPKCLAANKEKLSAACRKALKI